MRLALGSAWKEEEVKYVRTCGFPRVLVGFEVRRVCDDF